MAFGYGAKAFCGLSGYQSKQRRPSMSGEEQWRRVIGSPDYEISSHGQVRRLSTQQTKSPSVRPDGKLSVNLNVGSRSRVKLVHSLVAESFIRPRKSHEMVRFHDGDPKNCRLENLYYARRAAVVPSFPPAKRTLTAEDVARIRYLLDHGVTTKVVAGAFGVSSPQISNIKSGKKWSAS